MSRTTKTEVHNVFERLLVTLGVPKGGKTRWYDAKGEETTEYSAKVDLRCDAGWSLDYNSTYGGWIIATHDGEGTGVGTIGYSRMTSGPFVQAMLLMIHAHTETRGRAAMHTI